MKGEHLDEAVSTTRRDRPASCPHCGTDGSIPIVYGYPGAELRLLEQVGEASIGGCVITESALLWECRGCGGRW